MKVNMEANAGRFNGMTPLPNLPGLYDSRTERAGTTQILSRRPLPQPPIKTAISTHADETSPRYPMPTPSSSYSIMQQTPKMSPSSPFQISSRPPPPPSLSSVQETITPEELLKYLSSSQPPSILLLDIRSPTNYAESHIRHPHIVNIDPVILTPNKSALDVEHALVLLPDKEQRSFAERNIYEYVIFYDEISYGMYGPLDNLVSALWYSDFGKRKVRRIPLLLVGGFVAWRVLAGDTWIVHKSSKSVDSDKLLRRTSGDETLNKLLENHHRSDQQFVDNFTGRSRISFQGLSPTEQDEYTKKLRRKAAVHPGKPQQQQYARNLMDLFQQQQPLQSMSSNSYSISNNSYTSPYLGTGSEWVTPPPAARQKLGGYFPPYPNSNHLDSNSSSASMNPTSVATGDMGRRRTYVDHPFTGFSDVQHPDYRPPTLSRKNVGNNTSTATSDGVRPPAIAASKTPHRPLPNTPPTYERSGASTSEKMFEQPGRISSFISEHPQAMPLTNGLTGLKNLGNTCYMNSVLQCLSGTTPLARYFLTGSWQRHNRTDNSKGTYGALPAAFAQLLKVMWSGTYKFASPVTLRDKIAKFSTEFGTSDQQDAHEFQTWFLDKLHEDLNTIPLSSGKPPALTSEQELALERIPQQIAADWAWERHSRTDWSIISHLFEGLYQNRLQCLKCGRTSTTYSPFMSVSLPIPTNGNKSTMLERCLETFFKTEILEKEEGWNCPSCKSQQRASKQMKIAKLPMVLCLHLKRFSTNGHFRDKIDSMVSFPLQNLNMTDYTPPALPPTNVPITSNPDVAYALRVLGVPPDRVPRGTGTAGNTSGGSAPSYLFDLYAVTNHYGSLSGGHYTASVRSRGDWYSFDDSKQSHIESSYVATKSAYLLYYVRQKVV